MQALKSGEATIGIGPGVATVGRTALRKRAAPVPRRNHDLFLVLQRQTDLLVARSRELLAQTDLNKAISEFQRATGTTLSANNVTVSQKQEFTILPNRRNTAFTSPFFTK